MRQLFYIFLQFFVAVFDDLFTGDDADKVSLIIYNRNIILVDCLVQQILHVRICVNCLICCSSWDCHNGNALCFFQSGNI